MDNEYVTDGKITGSEIIDFFYQDAGSRHFQMDMQDNSELRKKTTAANQTQNKPKMVKRKKPLYFLHS